MLLIFDWALDELFQLECSYISYPSLSCSQLDNCRAIAMNECSTNQCSLKVASYQLYHVEVSIAESLDLSQLAIQLSYKAVVFNYQLVIPFHSLLICIKLMQVATVGIVQLVSYLLQYSISQQLACYQLDSELYLDVTVAILTMQLASQIATADSCNYIYTQNCYKWHKEH